MDEKCFEEIAGRILFKLQAGKDEQNGKEEKKDIIIIKHTGFFADYYVYDRSTWKCIESIFF